MAFEAQLRMHEALAVRRPAGKIVGTTVTGIIMMGAWCIKNELPSGPRRAAQRPAAGCPAGRAAACDVVRTYRDVAEDRVVQRGAAGGPNAVQICASTAAGQAGLQNNGAVEFVQGRETLRLTEPSM